jgi:UDP-N-acetylmuramoylalanine--D-glutamate ligase
MTVCAACAQNPVNPGSLAVVVGAGSSGAAAARLLHKLGARVRLLEKNAASLSGAVRREAEALGYELVAGPHEPGQFAGAALVVPSPGVPLAALEPLLARAGNPPWMAEMELASRFTSEPMVAVTGTSGKTTTVSLIAAMLRAGGKKVFLGGNIGTPLAEYVLGADKADVLVLETSSFQLMGCDRFHPKVAVLLNISPNHLDQHRDLAEYVDAKFRIFRNQTPEDTALVEEELLEEAIKRGLAAKLRGFTATERFPAARLVGRHNRANMEAAFQAAKVLGVSEGEAARAVAEFTPLPHRLELVGEWDGIAYINDTKCTTVSSLAAALESMERPTLLLAGGVFKGGDLKALLPLLQKKVKAICLFGASREVFSAAWGNALPLSWSPTLEEAMREARNKAEKGDALLLAPATSSFDLFANYGQRGEEFRRVARLLR